MGNIPTPTGEDSPPKTIVNMSWVPPGNPHGYYRVSDETVPPVPDIPPRFPGNLTPDKNLMVAAAAGIAAKAVLALCASHDIAIDAQTQGYILVLITWGAAHLYDVLTGDNKPN